MQCKDIPIEPILWFLENLPYHPGSNLKMSGTWFWDETCKPENSVARAMPEGTPEKLVLAKMRNLIRRGFVSGCDCGCRGNFEITQKGLSYLLNSEESNHV